MLNILITTKKTNKPRHIRPCQGVLSATKKNEVTGYKDNIVFNTGYKDNPV